MSRQFTTDNIDADYVKELKLDVAQDTMNLSTVTGGRATKLCDFILQEISGSEAALIRERAEHLLLIEENRQLEMRLGPNIESNQAPNTVSELLKHYESVLQHHENWGQLGFK